MVLEKVVLAKCNSYQSEEVEKAVNECLNLLGFDFSKYYGKKVLLKPNVLSPHKPNEAITTNPIIIETVCKILKKHKCKIFIGDSSFHDTAKSFEISGVKAVAEKYGKLINFEKEEKILLENENNHILKKIYLPKILEDVDLVINLPKLKTHSLTKMTCAVKNLFGCIPGGAKSMYHKKAHSEYLFSELLVELYEFLKPKIKLNIVDAIVGIEGEGPGTAGDKIKTNLILASHDALALDLIAAEVIGYKREDVVTNKIAIKKLIAPVPIELGSGKGTRLDYKKPKINILERKMGFLSKLLISEAIAFDYSRCIKCGLCARNCPTKAIHLKPFPIWGRRKCIKCFCCIEGCPKNAVYKKEHFTEKLAKKLVYFMRGL